MILQEAAVSKLGRQAGSLAQKSSPGDSKLGLALFGKGCGEHCSPLYTPSEMKEEK